MRCASEGRKSKSMDQHETHYHLGAFLSIVVSLLCAGPDKSASAGRRGFTSTNIHQPLRLGSELYLDAQYAGNYALKRLADCS